jgi:hypothetical protein
LIKYTLWFIIVLSMPRLGDLQLVAKRAMSTSTLQNLHRFAHQLRRSPGAAKTFFVEFGTPVLFSIGGIFCVMLTALAISVVQFQIRIIDAKNQSKNFYPNSLTQNVEMQRDFVDSIRYVQKKEPTIVNYVDLRTTYFPHLSEIAESTCAAGVKSVKPDNPDVKPDAIKAVDLNDPRTKCAFGIEKSLVDGGEKDYARRVFELYLGSEFETLSSPLQSMITTAIGLAGERRKFDIDNGTVLNAFRAKCLVIERYIKVTLHTGDASLQIQNSVAKPTDLNPASWMGSIPWEYIESAHVLCLPHLGLGLLTATPSDAAKANASLAGELKQIYANPDAQQMLAGPQQPPAPTDKSDRAEKLRTDLAGALLFDLMAYYSFYEDLFQVIGLDGKWWAEQFVKGPIEITFIALVIVCGALGAMLRLSVLKYNPQLLGRQFAQVKRSPAYYFAIGIMCALITYILAKTAFAGLSEASYSTKAGSLSPFVAAFLAIISGLMCEEALNQIMKAGGALLARSGGGAATAAKGKNKKDAARAS